MLTLPIRLSLPLTMGIAAILLAPATAHADPCGVNPGEKKSNCGLGGGGRGGNNGGAPDGGGGGSGVGDLPPIIIDPGGGDLEGGGGGAPPPAPVTLEDLTWQARASAITPTVTVHTSPTTQTYVRLRTGLWVDGFTRFETEPIHGGGMTVQAIGEPDYVEWDLGEQKITCDGAGSPRSTACNYVYQRSSTRARNGAYQVKATIWWSMSWTCTGACPKGGGALPALSNSSAPQPLTVGEIQTGN